MKSVSVLKLLLSVGVSFCASFIGSVATFSGNSFTWYDSLKKPFFTPPGWVFGPVWTLLYLMMGIAAFLLWQKGLTDSRVRIALACFIVQLIFNAAWSVIFFAFHSAGWALMDIVFLWLAIFATIVSFWRVDRLAAALLLPYLGWVSFAAILNAGLYWLNR